MTTLTQKEIWLKIMQGSNKFVLVWINTVADDSFGESMGVIYISNPSPWKEKKNKTILINEWPIEVKENN